MRNDFSVESSHVGPVVRPSHPSELTILYVDGAADRDVDRGSASGMAERLAERTNATVVCCDYRPAFADALDDVRHAYRSYEEAGPVSVVGSRMGAALAAALLVHLRDEGIRQPRSAVFLSALLDVTMKSRSLYLGAGVDPAFDADLLQRQVEDYAAGMSLTDPRVNALYANLHGLAPMQLLVASIDPLLDDSLSFAVRAAHDRVPVDVRVLPDTIDFSEGALIAMADFIMGSERYSLRAPSPMVS